MHTLSLSESVKLVKKHKIPFVLSAEVKVLGELKKAASKIGYPIAMKINSSKISHKSDVGGVIINIESFPQAKKVFNKMKKLKGFESVFVQKMVRGTEIIIGGKRDIQFGPTILVGLGGIYVEVFRDFQIGICPVNKSTAREMLKDLKSFPILKGLRGKKGINLKKLVETIVKVSKLMVKEKNLQELDLNPLIATPQEIVAVDARAVVNEN